MATKTQKPQKQPENFLEALRELGRDVVTEAKVQVNQIVTKDLPEALGSSHTSGTLKPNETVSLAQEQPEKTDTKINNQLFSMREQDYARARRSEAELKEQIKSIQMEIKSLALAAGDLAAEVQIATLQATVNPGVYHQHFFARLKSTIALLRKRVTESRNWLAEFNGRSKKKGYWAGVQKSGTSYMLSSERYAVTSTG